MDLDAAVSLLGWRARIKCGGVAASATRKPDEVGNRGQTMKKRSRRRRDPETEAVCKFCYEEYRVKGRKRANVMRDALARFGNKAPKANCNVTYCANGGRPSRLSAARRLTWPYPPRPGAQDVSQKRNLEAE